jgi:hypothetical protein
VDLIPAYLLIIACFLCCLFGMIAQKNSVRTALFFLWMALVWAGPWIVSLPVRFVSLLYVPMIPAAIIAHFVARYRLRHTPRIRVNDPFSGYRLVTFLPIFIFAVYVLLFRLLGNARPDDLTILLLVFVLALIWISFPCYAICGNGIWYWGELHTWDQYESYSWTTRDDAAVVELKQRERFREPFGSRLVRLTVPLEDIEAARQLLEANLANSASGEAKA